MHASELISDEIKPISLDITGMEALEVMNDWQITQIPVVHDGQFYGVLDESEILQYDIEERLAIFPLRFKKALIRNDEHLFDVMRLMVESELDVIPVQNDDKSIVGAITKRQLADNFAQRFIFHQPGPILILQRAKNDYVLSEIARIVENEDAVILHLGIENKPGSNEVEIHLKLSNTEISRIIAALNRYDYVVKAAFQADPTADLLKDRYDSLLHYLNM